MGLRVAAQRGLVAVFTALSHKCPSSRLGKHDETGMTLMQHAAVHNRPHIITILVQLGQDVNARKISSVFAAGLSSLMTRYPFTSHFSSYRYHLRIFPVAGANIWNSLPIDITSALSSAVFKQRLKTFLFRCCYDIV